MQLPPGDHRAGAPALWGVAAVDYTRIQGEMRGLFGELVRQPAEAPEEVRYHRRAGFHLHRGEPTALLDQEVDFGSPGLSQVEHPLGQAPVEAPFQHLGDHPALEQGAPQRVVP